ncbi:MULTISPECIES: TetR/AcrR family transcriptional regulator [unclassified Microbacterium]|uniref:TetR/AcrR family transcriptional regulator n=1 Tax=unclassified Microbacterium TaxID=2609290 RepID=UPI0012FABE04|nr:TetR family transcriptional regulator [Microbacterium sp. MAH-37]MVQ40973.1 TetR family transcriptional regulator [Microbacterium sp. MAH-37]
MATTRERALEAAVLLVGEEGVRALTHGRVDAAAGLPKGSTSNWFRTRDALIAGVLVWIAERERADLTAAMDPVQTPDELIDVLTRVLEDVTGREAARTRARYALFFETANAPGARPSMRDQRSMFENWTRDRLALLGARDPALAARALLATSAGIIVNRLTVAPDAPIRPAVELVVRASLPPR